MNNTHANVGDRKLIYCNYCKDFIVEKKNELFLTLKQENEQLMKKPIIINKAINVPQVNDRKKKIISIH